MRSLRILALILVSAVAVIGQTNKGGISGAVTDPAGAVIPGATVTITNLGTNETQTVTTSEEGTFSVRSLDPVEYSVTVEAANFKKAVLPNVKIDTATVATVNVSLEAGNVGEQVTIEAGAALINTENGTVGQTITERQIQDVPLSNRSVLDLAVTAPNVSGDAGSEDPEVTSGQPVPGYNLSLNGGRPGSTTILADGVNNTGVGIARAVVSFTPETVQEFTIQTSAYSAEFGQTGGGVINISTKPGTNNFNGTALVYHRNPETNARPFRTGTGPRPPNNLRYTQVSVSAGGPVFFPNFGEGVPPIYNGKNRTFFFVAFEPRWRQDFLSVTTLVPTAAERSGDFRGLRRTSSGWLPEAVAAQFNAASVGQANIYQQFIRDANGRLVPITLTSTTLNRFCQFGETPTAGTAANPQCLLATAPNPALNVIPQAYLDPTGQNLLQYMPTGGDYFIDDAGLVRNHVVNRFVRQDETRYTVRLDHNITENNKATFRYTLTPAVGIRGFGSDVNGNTAAYSDASQYLFSDNHIFSSNFVNELRFNYTRGIFSEDFSPEFSIYGGRNLATELGLPSLTSGGIPLFQITSDGNGYNAFANIGSSGSTNNYNKEERFNVNDIAYYTRGDMIWKFGFDISRAKLAVTPFFAASGGRYDFRVLQTANQRATGLANGGNSFASLLLGTPNVVDLRPLLLDYNYIWDSYAGFVQNDWKVKPNLTLNLGFRYSLQFPRREKDNMQGAFRPDLAINQTLTDAQRRAIFVGLGITNAATLPIPSYIPTQATIPAFAFSGRGGRSEYITPVDYSGYEPRFGFAYSPKIFGFEEKMSMVIRGGYGISHLPLTGNNRSPNPDFGSFVQASSTATGSSGATDPTQPIRLSGNSIIYSGNSLETALGIPSDGLVYTNSIGIPGFAFASGSGKVPYSQNWNLSLSFEPIKDLAVEVAYTGNKGTHLYLPLVNINPRNTDFVEFLEGQNISSDTTFADPLGRRNLAGAIIQVNRGNVLSPYFGFGTLSNFFDPSATSIRHAGYISVQRRIRNGLNFTANYTFGKSIDDASDASPDARVLANAVSAGQVSFGATRQSDRSISTFDIKHNFSSTFLYDLPFGKGRQFLAGAPGIVDAIVGGWTVSGVFRLQGGVPFLPYITDTNRLGGVNRNVRPDLVPGVPLKNPLWTRDCPIGNLCEPYINPAAFMRPAKGSLGNAPRTLDVRAPMQRYFDFSVQKNFRFPFASNEGKRRIQLRVDLLNAFNHPNFRLANTNSGGVAGFTGGLPVETDFTAAEITNYNAATGRSVTAAQVNAILAANRLPNGTLPLNFFNVAVPQGFAGTTVNSFDITTAEGIRLYRLRQQYDNSFGTLREVASPRYIQFGLKIYF